MAESASARATALPLSAYTPLSPLPSPKMAGAASATAPAPQFSGAASTREFSRESHQGKMAAPTQGGGGGAPGEAGSGARPRWGPPQPPRVSAELASNPAYLAAQRKLKVRNALTGLAIGAVVVGIYGYTFYSIRQESFLEELELEAKAMQARAPKTSAN